ncbi:MAG: PH domain-containing protein [Rhodospirillaceae bacterium]|nr:PH domain-containing protein [Rhodospirillaceae bacterium]
MNGNVRYEANPSMFRNRPITFLICLVSLILWPILLIWRIQAISTKILITDESVQYEKGLLAKTRVDLRIDKIRTVSVKQGLIQRMLGAGDIAIYTSGDVPEIVIGGMKDPHKIRQLLTG